MADIETPAGDWVQSSACNGASSCVEVACVDGHVLVRDSKLGDDSPVLCFTVGSWWSYLATVKSHRLHAYDGPVVLSGAGDEWRMRHLSDPGVVLVFDQAEAAAFLAGVEAGEFDPSALKAAVAVSAVVASGGDAASRVHSVPLAAS